MYEIKKNIPLRKTRIKFPFEEMEVGDCFDIPLNDVNGNIIRSTVAGSVRCYRKFNPEFKIVTRTVDDVIRVWRVK